MYYNLELFGKKLKEIRIDLNLNPKEMAKKTFVADKTIRRYESGKVLPNFDILETMSPYYKTDLVALLIQCRFDDYPIFNTIKNRIEMRLSNQETDLQKELRDLNTLLSSTKNKYSIIFINQLIVFIEAIYLYRDEKNDLAYDKFIEAIKITTKNFNIDNYESYIFSSTEVRILMNIALIYNRMHNDNEYVKMMEFCSNSVESTDDICPMICNNLASAYIRNKNYQKALEYSNIGIQARVENQNANCLSNLYYTKGYAECRLNMKEHVESLYTSIYLCKALKQDKLKSIIIEKCKKYLDVDLSNL